MLTGLLILLQGVSQFSLAADDASSTGSAILLNSSRFACAAAALLDLVEGNLGALILVSAGIATMIAAAFGAYKAAASLLAVAVAGFILRSLVAIFFGDLIGAEGSPSTCKLEGQKYIPFTSPPGEGV